MGLCRDIGRWDCRPVEAVATLDVRAMVFWGYMPYGWLGPVSKGLSPLEVVAKEPVELTDARCARGDGEDGLWWWCVASGRPALSCAIESRVFAVLLRVAILLRLASWGFDMDVWRWGVSSRSWAWAWACLWWLPSSLVLLAGRKPSDTEGMKSSSSGSTS